MDDDEKKYSIDDEYQGIDSYYDKLTESEQIISNDDLQETIEQDQREPEEVIIQPTYSKSQEQKAQTTTQNTQEMYKKPLSTQEMMAKLKMDNQKKQSYTYNSKNNEQDGFSGEDGFSVKDGFSGEEPANYKNIGKAVISLFIIIMVILTGIVGLINVILPMFDQQQTEIQTTQISESDVNMKIVASQFNEQDEELTFQVMVFNYSKTDLTINTDDFLLYVINENGKTESVAIMNTETITISSNESKNITLKIAPIYVTDKIDELIYSDLNGIEFSFVDPTE